MNRSVAGVVRTGLGQAAAFTTLPWVQQQVRRTLGMDTYPGTLNLVVGREEIAEWGALSLQPGLPMAPERPGECAARCYPVLACVPGRAPVTAGILVPEVPGYAPDQIEVLAAVPLRQLLRVADGDMVMLRTVPVPALRAALFDVDGTLVNSIAGYRLAAQRAVEPYGWSVSQEAVSAAMNFGEPFWDLVVPPESRGDLELIAKLRRDTLAHWPAILADSVLLYPETGAMLATLKAAGVRLGICTASHGESFLPLEQSGLLDLFDQVVTAKDVTHRKPDPEGLLLCLDRMGVAAAESAYIGDTVADVRASHAAGLYAVGMLTGAGDSALLSAAGAHRLLADLRYLPELLLGSRQMTPSRDSVEISAGL